MDAKEILLTVAATALGWTKDEVEAKLEDAEDSNPLNTLLNQHKTKVKEQKETNFNNGEKKARAEVLSKFEQELKEELGIESDKKGLDLVREALETKAKTTDSDDDGEEKGKKKLLSLKDIPEDLVKKHPLFLAKEKEVKDVEEKVSKKWQSEVEAVKAEYAEKETFKTVAERALVEFDKLKPLLSQDPDKAARQKQDFINKIKATGNKWEFVGEDILILDENGNKKEDAHGNTLKFSDFIRSTAELYHDFKVAEDRSSAGITTKAANTDGEKYSGKWPANQDQFNEMRLDPNIPLAQRNLLDKEWQEKQTSNV